jgi:hypothetical protein
VESEPCVTESGSDLSLQSFILSDEAATKLIYCISHKFVVCLKYGRAASPTEMQLYFGTAL